MILANAQRFSHPGEKPVDVVLEDGVIIAVVPAGTASHDGHEVIDLDERVIIPGLWDEHVHFGLWAQHRKRVDVSQATSAAEAASMMARAIASSAPVGDAVVVGTGYRDGLWPDQKTTALLDLHTGDVPTLLLSVDVHSCWVNTATLRKYGIQGHDEDGVLREGECFAVTGAIGEIDDAVLDRWVLEAAEAAASRGVVGVVDLEMRYNPDDWVRRQNARDEMYPLQVVAGVYPEHLDQAIAQGLRSGMPLAENLVMGPLKIITDGSLNTRTAHCVEPYLGVDGDHYGAMNFPISEIEDILVRAHTNGLDLAVHAIGDEANRLILDLMEKNSLTGRIEHAQLVRSEDFPRFAALGIQASVQPEHAVDDRDVTDVYWADRADRAFALRTLVDQGATVVLGSDAPVAPLDPWVAIAAAVTRTRDGRTAWQPQQALTLDEAIRFSTRSRVEAGQPADIVVLDADPRWLLDACGSDAGKASDVLRAMPIAYTLCRGVVTYQAE